MGVVDTIHTIDREYCKCREIGPLFMVGDLATVWGCRGELFKGRGFVCACAVKKPPRLAGFIDNNLERHPKGRQAAHGVVDLLR